MGTRKKLEKDGQINLDSGWLTQLMQRVSWDVDVMCTGEGCSQIISEARMSVIVFVKFDGARVR